MRRAARTPSPQAARVVFAGVLAAPDGFGRLRVLLVERFADGTPDYASVGALRRAAPGAGPGYGLPYELDAVPRDEVRGIATVAVPAAHRAHWVGVAADLRGREVRVEATLRPYAFAGRGGAREVGGARDLAQREPRAASERPRPASEV